MINTVFACVGKPFCEIAIAVEYRSMPAIRVTVRPSGAADTAVGTDDAAPVKSSEKTANAEMFLIAFILENLF